MNGNELALLFNCVFPFLCKKWPVHQIVQQPHDFIVVGAGSAGAVIANRLSENPNVEVLLLEAGGCPPFMSEIPAMHTYLLNTTYDWKYKTTSQSNSFLAYPNKQVAYPRGKMLGGSSSINGMIYLRGNKHEFDHWAKLGNVGWSYKDVLPYFLKSEDMAIPQLADDTIYHNTTGPLTLSYADVNTKFLDIFLEAGEAAGYPTRDLNAANQTGFMRQYFNIRNGSRCSTAKAYLIPALGRPNLKIVCNSHVTKILFDKNKKAYGVYFVHNDTNYKARASKEVILSAGAINSPQLLMLSGVGPHDQLNKFKIPVVANHPGVGENFQDHVGTALAFKVNCTDCVLSEENFTSPLSFQQWKTSGEGVLTLPFGMQGLGYMNTKYAIKSGSWPDIQLGSTSPFSTTALAAEFGPPKEVLDNMIKPLGKNQTFGLGPYLMRPKSRGSVKLQSNSPFDDPLIDLNYFSHPDDIKALVEGMILAIEIGNSEAFKKLGAELSSFVMPGCENNTFLSHEYLECYARQLPFVYFHAVGTCKMGLKSDPMAVVDHDLNVIGVQNLRLVDASVMPTVVSANTNAATIMIAEKAADIIKQQCSL